MAELLVDFITSLDGYASAEGWPGWWGLEGPEYLDWLTRVTRGRVDDPDGRHDVPTHVAVRRGRRGGRRRAGRHAEGGVLLHPDRAADLGEHAPRRGRRRRGRPVDEGRPRRSRPAHDRQPHAVPDAARGGARRPVPRRHVPRDHGEHRAPSGSTTAIRTSGWRWWTAGRSTARSSSSSTCRRSSPARRGSSRPQRSSAGMGSSVGTGSSPEAATRASRLLATSSSGVLRGSRGMASSFGARAARCVAMRSR